MNNPQEEHVPGKENRIWRGDLIFATTLFLTAAVALTNILPRTGILAGQYDWGTALFFLLFGVFTITMGYARPGLGHISFDRVAQISSVLVLGPVDAAWINGLASLIYPSHRIWKGVPLRDVVVASLHNSGMTTLVILACGSLYVYLGGPIPLFGLDLRTGGLLLLLMLSMQGMNDALMATMVFPAKKGPIDDSQYILGRSRTFFGAFGNSRRHRIRQIGVTDFCAAPFLNELRHDGLETICRNADEARSSGR